MKCSAVFAGIALLCLLTTKGLNASRPAKGEEPVLEKWRNFEKQVQKMSSTLVRSLMPVLMDAATKIDISPACSRSVVQMLMGIKKMKTWAYAMIDAGGKLPIGMLGGNVNSLGDYDLCVNVQVPGNLFKGKYCTIALDLPLPERKPFVPVDLELPEFVNFTDSSTFIARILQNTPAYYLLELRSSLCVPSTCTDEDVRAFGQYVMDLAGLEFGIKVPNCEVSREIVLDPTEIAIVTVLIIIFFVGVVSTIFDVYLCLKYDDPSTLQMSLPSRCLLCFSYYKNTKNLLSIANASENIEIFHGMKVITLMWVILIHTYYYVNVQACKNLTSYLDFKKAITFQLVANGFLSVQAFFFMAGTLISYIVTRMDRDVNPFLYIAKRLWRLTPSFMLVIGFAILIPKFGDGPIWEETVSKTFVNNCKQNWWANLLYINNFLPVKDMCFSWFWYIAADTHLYIIVLFVVIPLKKNPKVAMIVNGVLLVIGILSTIINNVYYQLNPLGVMAYIHPDDGFYFAERGYFRSYLHLPTYCVGLGTGYFLATRKKFRIPLVVNIFGWLTSFVLGLSVLYGVYEWNQGNVPGLALSTLYACTHKLVWALALSWVTIACMTGHGGVVKWILGWKAFVPLSRLTYMTYLIHPIVQFIYVGSSRSQGQADHRTAALTFIGYVVASFICAYPFSLMFESPFMALEKLVFGNKTPKTTCAPSSPSQEPSSSVANESDSSTSGKANKFI